MKIVDLDEIYNYIVLGFSFEVTKILKKLIYDLDSILSTCASIGSSPT
jgi:hypothetical protein